MDGYLSRSFMETMSKSVHVQRLNVGDEGLRRLPRARDFRLVARSDHRMTATLLGDLKQEACGTATRAYFFYLFTALGLIADFASTHFMSFG